MIDYTQFLPVHEVERMGKHELHVEVYRGNRNQGSGTTSISTHPPLLLVHGAYTGSWMWSKYIPHFVEHGWTCYAMNLRSHYRSRVMDMTRITVEDYLEDIREVLSLLDEPPILVGFSMGGILSQKVAETADLAGLIIIDTSISREVHDALPYPLADRIEPGIIMPAPLREENETIDETPEDIAFQRHYLQMESAKAFRTFSALCGAKGISVDGDLITCPGLVIKAVLSEDEEQRGRLTAKQLGASYFGLWGTTHTGLLVGQRYKEAVDVILEWLDSNYLGKKTG